MPTKNKSYYRVKFPPEIILKAYKKFLDCLEKENRESYSSDYHIQITEEETWHFDTESEFFSEYRKDIQRANFRHQHNSGKKGTAIFNVIFNKFMEQSSIRVELQDRAKVEDVFEVFESTSEIYKTKENLIRKNIENEVNIFIGHGKNPLWKEVKDHLQDIHGFKVVCYETGARAGYTITEVLEEMSNNASFALLILTGENDHNDGTIHARENVIHETGLFQGKLGFKKSIVLLEEDCKEFTNISGVQQIRFQKKAIKETFGDILATIYREFGSKALIR